MSKLLEIVNVKHKEIIERKEDCSLAVLEAQVSHIPSPRDFMGALKAKHAVGLPAVIAEAKKASPSKGLLCADFDPVSLAKAYEAQGAACMSVLTDESFFQGSTRDLQFARKACGLPVLRKDFIVDHYQVLETRVMGADCMLLIVAALDDAQLTSLYRQALDLGLCVLIEVHNKQELDRALVLEPELIGINNRNLQTFKTDLHTTLELLPFIPQDVIVVSESGILNRPHVDLIREAGVNTFLVGEALVTAKDPADQFKVMFGG